ncbi:MAG: DNA double-strand break repair nuclease NurA [Thermofilaceae archaeon]
MSALSDALSTIESLIRAVEERVSALAQPISGEPFERVGFIDGSYAMDERRGVYVLALSAASIVVNGGRMEGVLRGSAKPHITLLAPKSYAESRASMLMSIFELLGAVDLVRRGVEAVFLDGSYVSEMMVPFGHARDVYERFNPLSAGVRAGALDEWGEASSKAALEAAAGELPASLAELLERIYSHSNGVYSEICGVAPDVKSRKEALDFAVVYCETTAYLALLNHLLDECERRGVKPFWVAKDAESRYIVEREGVLGWLNDLSLLDYAWRDRESVHTTLKGVPIHKPKPCALWTPLLDEVYERWGGYGVSYFKFGRAGAVSQMTYPHFVGEEDVSAALATLQALADHRGYPRPLSYVHHIAVLNPEFAKLIADELYRREKNPILKSMLAPSGRAMAGLR